MARSLHKGPSCSKKLRQKVLKAKASGKRLIEKIWCRQDEILDEYIGFTFGVHNGKSHISVLVTQDMVGHRFGEFAPTRTFRGHSGNNKKGK